MSQQRRPHPEAGLGQLGGALMMATHGGQNVNRNLARHRYTPTPQPQPRQQTHAQQQARIQAHSQSYYQPSPTDVFNFRLSLLTSQRIPVNLSRKRR
jgi:hypothetical protein